MPGHRRKAAPGVELRLVLSSGEGLPKSKKSSTVTARSPKLISLISLRPAALSTQIARPKQFLASLKDAIATNGANFFA